MKNALLLGLLLSLCLHAAIVIVPVTQIKSEPSVSSSASALVVSVQTKQKQSLKGTEKNSADISGKAGVKETSKVELIGSLAPEYPWRSRMQAQEGTVVIDVLVASDGKAKDMTVVKSSGHESLDKAAIEAVKKASFTKHDQNFVPLQLSLNFRLRDRP